MTKTEQFKELLKLTTDSLTKTEFLDAFKTVLDFCKKAVQDLTQKYQAVISRTEVEISTKLSNLEEKVDTKLSQVKNGRDGVNGEKGADGKDADTDSVAILASKLAISEVQKSIPTIDAIMQELPQAGASIRDGLELLKGDERLEISAIKDLQELLDEIKKEKTRVIGGGGFSAMAMYQHFSHWSQMTGTVDGTNKDFTLGVAPNPIESLEVMVDNSPLFETSDWTYAPATKTVSFILAPPLNSIPRYKCLR